MYWRTSFSLPSIIFVNTSPSSDGRGARWFGRNALVPDLDPRASIRNRSSGAYYFMSLMAWKRLVPP
ncbi:MAG: hypothetical protein Q6365_002115, partial [Candidatus Sigynarchaeota archaeon]